MIDERPELVRFSITENCETALHIAASSKSTKFVKSLVNVMQREDLELQNINYNTALCIAAVAGTVEMADCMVQKNKSVLNTQGSKERMPLYMAAFFGKHDMVKYLYQKSQNLKDDLWTDKKRSELLLACLDIDMFDIALDILSYHPNVHTSISMYALQTLALNPAAFVGINQHPLSRIYNSIVGVKLERHENSNLALQVLTVIWYYVIRHPVPEIWKIIKGPCVEVIDNNGSTKNTFPSRALFLAAEIGNSKFIIQLIHTYPDLIWTTDDHNRSIFHVAVLHRQESVFNILYEIGSMKDFITSLEDDEGNNMLHLAAKRAKRDPFQTVLPFALQMQRELQWFQEVEIVVPPSYKKRKNKDNQTPRQLFSKEHISSASEGERWMKDIISQCMVVAALAPAIVFAAAFTVPGGYNQDNGIPIFLRKSAFLVFMISDVISLFSSSASILIFLSILTSRYTEQFFLESLPRKLMIGLATLFLSVMTMMVAFTATIFIFYKNELKWMIILVSVLASLPWILYVSLQIHLFRDVIHSVFSSNPYKPKRHVLD